MAVYVAALDGTGVHRLNFQGGAALRPSWSPDGNWIAFTQIPQIARPDLLLQYPFNSSVTAALDHASIEVMHRDGTDLHSLLDRAYQPSWSPSGEAIAFVSQRTGTPDIYVARADGSGLMRLTAGVAAKFWPAWRH
jgi:TolB protein